MESRVTGSIGPGFLVLAGFAPTDTDTQLAWMAEKILGLRVFGDAEGKMNRDLAEVNGGVLVVSQFTLYGDASKGRRPSFIDAAPPNLAIPLEKSRLVSGRESRKKFRESRFPPRGILSSDAKYVVREVKQA